MVLDKPPAPNTFFHELTKKIVQNQLSFRASNLWSTIHLQIKNKQWGSFTKQYIQSLLKSYWKICKQIAIALVLITQLFALCNLGLFIWCKNCVYIIITLLLIRLLNFILFLFFANYRYCSTVTTTVSVIGSKIFFFFACFCVFFCFFLWFFVFLLFLCFFVCFCVHCVLKKFFWFYLFVFFPFFLCISFLSWNQLNGNCSLILNFTATKHVRWQKASWLWKQ